MAVHPFDPDDRKLISGHIISHGTASRRQRPRAWGVGAIPTALRTTRHVRYSVTLYAPRGRVTNQITRMHGMGRKAERQPFPHHIVRAFPFAEHRSYGRLQNRFAS